MVVVKVCVCVCILYVFCLNLQKTGDQWNEIVVNFLIVESKNINVITRPMNIDLVIHWRNWNGINNEEWYKEYKEYIYIYIWIWILKTNQSKTLEQV